MLIKQVCQKNVIFVTTGILEDIGFKYEPHLCNGCHDLMQKDLTYYQRNRDVILNKAKDYYKNNQERLREQARNKYRNLSEEEKNKKREYGKNRYLNMSEEKKQRLKEYQKNCREAKKI